jgi:hypothetical protein
MIRTLIASAFVLPCLAVVPQVEAQDGSFPKPSVYPVSWELRFNFDTPKRIAVDLPGEALPKAYWYVTYQVSNLTDRERMFLPVFELMTDAGELQRSDRNIPRVVFDRIKARVGDAMLQPAVRIAGPLLIGPEQVKHGVAIFEEPAQRVPGFTIFIAGLSGETAVPTDPSGQPLVDADGRPIVLRKTLKLDYTTRGDEFYAGEDVVELLRREWVMR